MSHSPERDPVEAVEKAFDDFAGATETSLQRMAEKLGTLCSENTRMAAEIETLKLEQRSAPTPASQPTIDTDALAVRAAALVPPPTIDLDDVAARAVARIPAPKDGRDGRDAQEVNIAELEARIAELVIPKITAVIPAPKDGEKGERGDDGLTSLDEVRAAVREEVLAYQRSFYKGVFTTDSGYRTADAVTYAGSMWFATHDNPSVKPGQGDGWVLAVKCGRDGKDARK